MTKRTLHQKLTKMYVNEETWLKLTGDRETSEYMINMKHGIIQENLPKNETNEIGMILLKQINGIGTFITVYGYLKTITRLKRH